MALSEMAVRHAKATGKAYTLGDTDGLALSVSKQGSRSWHFRYSWVGKQKRMSLGTYPEISLREARVLRDQARALLAKNINPKLDRKYKRQAVRLANENTFKAVYLRWLEYRKLELKEGRNSTLAQIRRNFERDVLPLLGGLPIYDVRRADLLDVLARIEKRAALTTASKIRGWLNQLFRFALVKIESLETNPASDLGAVALPKPPIIHNPFLHLHELPELLQNVHRYRGANTTKLGIRLLFLTGVRTGELRLATPDQFDLEKGVWSIPPEVVKQLQVSMRTKGNRSQDVSSYIVPLSVQAIEIIRYLLKNMKPAQRYLLSHRSELKKRISENTLNSALGRMGYKDLLTGHGIRGTISTALNEIGYPKIWVDAQLSHSDPNQVSAAYNHAMHVEPRRKMMQDWADRLDLLEQGQVALASTPLTINIGGVPALFDDRGITDVWSAQSNSDSRSMSGNPIVVTPALHAQTFQRLSHIPVIVPKPEPEISVIQREREEMRTVHESPNSLTVPVFAKLAGKSREQLNRELKAGKLLSIDFGNRGRRVPDWQLIPHKLELVQEVMRQTPEAEAWDVYFLVAKPHPGLENHAAIDVVTPTSLHKIVQILLASQHDVVPENVAISPQLPEPIRY